MNLESQFQRYPNIGDVFWPCAKGITYQPENPHPLIALVLSNDPKTSEIATRTDKCCQLIINQSKDWIKKKVSTIIREQDFSNVSAALGEIRAFGELIWVWGQKVIPLGSGNDFELELDGLNIRIEVKTPQHRIKRQSLEHETFESEKLKGRIFEIFPFGWPEREVDTIQGEAVSKLASIKQKEHQFETDSINILWIDIKDPVLWRLDFGSEQFLPLSAFREEVTSGAFWNAFYAKKDTYIYDQLSVLGLPSRTYNMEYNGRFWNESLVDFVIADTRENQVVFQNPNRNTQIPDRLYRDLHRLFAFNLELSWLDWPVRGQLKTKIKMELARIQMYKDAICLE